MENFRKFGLCVLRTQLTSLRHDYSTKSGLLKDLNVLDLSRVIAGPFCTMTLGDLGANVIKVESLGGDEARRWGPPFINEKKENDSFYYLSVNRNKKSICIDFKSQEGKFFLTIKIHLHNILTSSCIHTLEHSTVYCCTENARLMICKHLIIFRTDSHYKLQYISTLLLCKQINLWCQG